MEDLDRGKRGNQGLARDAPFCETGLWAPIGFGQIVRLGEGQWVGENSYFTKVMPCSPLICTHSTF